MTVTQKRNAILLLTYCLLVTTAGFVTARFVAWQHEGWAGFWYTPSLGPEFKGKTLMFNQGSVSNIFSGGPAEAAGLTVGDVLLTINGISISNSRQLVELDDNLKVNDELTYQIKRHDGSPATVRVRLASPLRSRQITVSALTSFAVALAFSILGTLVYWRKPEDTRALIFYFLSFVATLLFTVSPLVYVDEFPSRGARSLAQMTGHQIILYVAGAILGYAGQVLILHLSLVFPRKRPVLERGSHVLQWLYLTPVLQFVGFPTFFILSLPSRWLHAGLAILWLLLLLILGYIATRAYAGGWKRALSARPMMVLGASAFLIVAGMDTILTTLPSEGTRQTIGWVFGGLAFGLTSVFLFAAYSIIACISLYRGYRDSGVEERKQVRWPLWGTIVGVSGVLLLVGLHLLLAAFGLQRFLPTILTEVGEKACYVLIPVSFAFAILKYRLMDIDIVIRKTVTYSIVSGTVVTMYLGIAGGLGGLLITRTGVHSTWITVGATLAAVALFVPVRDKVQGIVNERFFRRKEDLPQALRALTAKTSEIADLHALLEIVAEHLVQTLKVRNAVIFRKSLREQSFEPDVEVGLHDRIDPGPLLKGLRFARDTPLLAPSAVTFRPPGNLPGSDQLAVAELGAALIVPVRRREETIGFISLGCKLSDQEFESDEIQFLAAVAEQTATAIYNLHLRKQAQEYEEAREIQQGLMPKEIPEIRGLEISGSWRPARIVGGDYFDVYNFSERRVGLCIADVSGKGMPAALLMSNLQAVVKALASENTLPKELVEKVNRVMWRNTTEAKFITLFYGLLDVDSKTLRYANAGHNAPVLTRKEGAQVRLEEGGLILGIFEERSYQQGEVELRPGDRLVMFTDGVSEATDGEGQEFGEERIAEVSRCNRQLPAEALHRSLLERVTEFCGGEFEDDATILVLAVKEDDRAIAM